MAIGLRSICKQSEIKSHSEIDEDMACYPVYRKIINFPLKPPNNYAIESIMKLQWCYMIFNNFCILQLLRFPGYNCVFNLISIILGCRISSAVF